MLKVLKSFPIINTSLFIISTYMSALMFIIIADSVETKIAMVILAVIFEFTKLSDLKKSVVSTKTRYIYLISYILKALLSVIASLGLILTLFSNQDRIFNSTNENQDISNNTLGNELDYWSEEIKQIDLTISILNDNLTKLPPGYGKAGTSFVSQISSLQGLKEKYRGYYNSVLNEQQQNHQVELQSLAVNPSDMFIELSNLTNIDYSKIRLSVFLLIMILIEVSLALGCITNTASENINLIHHNKDISDNRGNMKLTKQAYKTSIQLVNLQAERELKNMRLLTQKELSSMMSVSTTKINNVVRRYVRPIMKTHNFSDYLACQRYLKSIH